MYWFEFNGVRSDVMQTYITKRPSINPPTEELTTHRIAGRDGVLVSARYLAPVEIEIELNFRSAIDEFEKDRIAISAWLSGSGRLILGDDDGAFYKVQSVQINSMERTVRRIGRFHAIFTAEPYRYLFEGLEPFTMNSDLNVIYNPTNLIAHPVYTIQHADTIIGQTVYYNRAAGYEHVPSGMFGYTVGEVGPHAPETLTIDTERQVFYGSDGSNYTYSYQKRRGTVWDMAFEHAYITPGINEIVKPYKNMSEWIIVPNWRTNI
ncbi:MAG: hypothetical protein Q4B09_05010 [Lachnospiraceae bacterium]|nr:hypothetical protein [Lachnospiraceae bacterium]